MNLLLNLVWLILGGFIVVIAYLLGALLLCITIIGIPFGIQCFKLAGLAIAPFGREVVEKQPPSGALAGGRQPAEPAEDLVRVLRAVAGVAAGAGGKMILEHVCQDGLDCRRIARPDGGGIAG